VFIRAQLGPVDTRPPIAGLHWPGLLADTGALQMLSGVDELVRICLTKLKFFIYFILVLVSFFEKKESVANIF
jgi:hypothetical protein